MNYKQPNTVTIFAENTIPGFIYRIEVDIKFAGLIYRTQKLDLMRITIPGSIHRLIVTLSPHEFADLHKKNSIQNLTHEIPFVLLTMTHGAPQGSLITLRPNQTLIPVGRAEITAVDK